MERGSNYGAWGLLYMFLLMMASWVSSDIAKDRDECANQLVGLATCLPYVSGTAKVPTLDCCTGLKQVLDKNKKCLCILIKDRNDPSLGLKINATLALGLPDSCHAPANVSKCPELLHLSPSSPEAQIFEQFANSSKGSETAASVTAGKNSTTSGYGGSGEKRLVVEMMSGVWLWCLGLALLFIIDVWK